jgi:phage tail tape-measure protein
MQEHEKEDIGKMVGMGLGAAGGARLGAILIPIPLVGAFTGGVLGAALGSEVGRNAGKAVINGALAFGRSVAAEVRGEQLAPAQPTPPQITRGGYV